MKPTPSAPKKNKILFWNDGQLADDRPKSVKRVTFKLHEEEKEFVYKMDNLLSDGSVKIKTNFRMA